MTGLTTAWPTCLAPDGRTPHCRGCSTACTRPGCEVVVADLTTDEARQVGAHVVRVLVPELMPLSFAHRARYLAHPRLYRAPAALGHRVHREPELNPHPQPFA